MRAIGKLRCKRHHAHGVFVVGCDQGTCPCALLRPDTEDEVTIEICRVSEANDPLIVGITFGDRMGWAIQLTLRQGANETHLKRKGMRCSEVGDGHLVGFEATVTLGIAVVGGDDGGDAKAVGAINFLQGLCGVNVDDQPFTGQKVTDTGVVEPRPTGLNHDRGVARFDGGFVIALCGLLGEYLRVQRLAVDCDF